MKKLLIGACILTLGMTACVEDEVYKGPATISDVTIHPTTVTPDDDVVVSAKVTDLHGISKVTLQYKVGSGNLNAVEMSGTGTFTGTIPKQADKAVVAYYVEALNTAGIKSTSSELTYTVGAIPVDYSQLVLNELNGNDKFIELFNKGTKSIPLEGVYIEKDGGKVWTGYAGLSLGAGEYLLLYSEDVAASHPTQDSRLFFGSGLSAKKAVRVQLFTPATAGIDDFNLVDYTVPAAASYSRFPNGTGPWVYASATPKAVNATGGDAVTGLQ